MKGQPPAAVCTPALPMQVPEGLQSLLVGAMFPPYPAPGPPGSQLETERPWMNTPAEALGHLEGPVTFRFVPTLRSIQSLKLSSKLKINTARNTEQAC